MLFNDPVKLVNPLNKPILNGYKFITEMRSLNIISNGKNIHQRIKTLLNIVSHINIHGSTIYSFVSFLILFLSGPFIADYTVFVFLIVQGRTVAYKCLHPLHLRSCLRKEVRNVVVFFLNYL